MTTVGFDRRLRPSSRVKTVFENEKHTKSTFTSCWRAGSSVDGERNIRNYGNNNAAPVFRTGTTTTRSTNNRDRPSGDPLFRSRTRPRSRVARLLAVRRRGAFCAHKCLARVFTRDVTTRLIARASSPGRLCTYVRAKTQTDVCRVFLPRRSFLTRCFFFQSPEVLT